MRLGTGGCVETMAEDNWLLRDVLIKQRLGFTDVYDYDAFGNPASRTGSTASDFTYRGEQMDSVSGLQYLRVRWWI